jgi:hypothetical protein
MPLVNALGVNSILPSGWLTTASGAMNFGANEAPTMIINGKASAVKLHLKARWMFQNPIIPICGKGNTTGDRGGDEKLEASNPEC